MFIDTHCHIDDEKLTDKDKVVEDFSLAKVKVAINMGCDLKTTENGLNLSKKYHSVYFAAGFHPSEIEYFDADALEKIKNFALDEKCVAIGEIGLDYHWLPFDKDKQIDGFNRQIDLANQLKLPISVHCRDATEDTLKVLKSNLPKFQGVMHCFSGSVETAKILLDLGFYISFAGTLTFKNARNLVDVAKYVPLDRCLTETDSPYLAPTPYRGSINSPSLVPLVARRLAEIKALDEETLACAVLTNAKTLFKKLKI